MCQDFQEIQTGLLPGLVVLGLVIGARSLGLWQFLELRLLDVFMQLSVPEAPDSRIVLVAIDETTIRQAGTYPLPDSLLADLLQRIQQSQPRAIGLDIFRDLPVEPGHGELTTVLQAADNLIGIEKALFPTVSPPPSLPPDRVGITDSFLDPDGRQRHIILGTRTPGGTNAFKFSFALRVAQLYLETEGIHLANGTADPTAMRFGTVEIPRLHPNFGGYVGGNAPAGTVQALINFRRGPQPFQVLRAEALLAGNFDPGMLRDRIVLLGVTAPSVPDRSSAAATSVIDREAAWVYGLEVQAHAIGQIVNAVLDGRPLLRAWSDGWESAWIVFWGSAGIGFAARSRTPRSTLLWSIGFAAISIGASYGLFLAGWWVPVIPAVAALGLNALGLAAVYEYDRRLAAIVAAERERIAILEDANAVLEQRVTERTREIRAANQRLEHLLEQLESELQIAQKVQETMLPKVDRGDAKTGYNLAASLEPARTLGGDFYDFFLLAGEDRLCFAIGDVSDKGTPAALFMARTIASVRALADKHDTPISILQKVNAQLCRDNDRCMFVTLFCGILDIQTGRLSYASAGHEPPLTIEPQGRRVRFLELDTGPPLGIEEEATFLLYETQLHPADLLLLYTDGITEARNHQQEEFATQRLAALFSDKFPSCSKEAIETVKSAVEAFAGTAESWDDATLLCLQYQTLAQAEIATTSQQMICFATYRDSSFQADKCDRIYTSLAIETNPVNLEKVRQKLYEILQENPAALQAFEDIWLITEEVLTNIIKYGYAGRTAEPIQINLCLEFARLHLSFTDSGKPFNPLEETAKPAIDDDMEERPIGGLGIFLVGQLADRLEYTYREGKNVLTLEKGLAASAIDDNDNTIE